MHTPGSSAPSSPLGLSIHRAPGQTPESMRDDLLARLGAADLATQLRLATDDEAVPPRARLWLDAACLADWAPGYDTTGLTARLGLDTEAGETDLLREILIAMLLAPFAFEFPSVDEVESAVFIRRNIVQGARQTVLDFATDGAERPEDCWTYDEDLGFTLLPGVNLVDALIKTTQPHVSGRKYSFSCYRATEYVTLLGIAQELARCNPDLYARLESLWRQRAVMSEEFHAVFLREQGSAEQPVPPLYYVPGDRVWFRNPDEDSADACGFEGSWVMYLGSGQFTNFWESRQHYSLTHKAVEIFHWRHGIYRDAQGETQMDEDRIAPMIAATLNNPAELNRVMARMTRWREPQGVYTEAGGCMDMTREFARWVRPGSSDMPIPMPQQA